MRGNKGVGATYLAYGFNHIEVATKFNGKVFSGVMRNGREWVEDRTETIPRPRVETCDPSHEPFQRLDKGTSMKLNLIGKI